MLLLWSMIQSEMFAPLQINSLLLVICIDQEKKLKSNINSKAIITKSDKLFEKQIASELEIRSRRKITEFSSVCS